MRLTVLTCLFAVCLTIPIAGQSIHLLQKRAEPAATIDPPALLDFAFGTSLAAESCSRPAVVDYFSISDAKLIVWLRITGVQKGDAMSIAYTPPHAAEQRSNFSPFASAGTYCASTSIPLSTFPEAEKAGDWNFRVLVNNSKVAAAATVVIGPKQPRIDSVRVYGGSKQTRLSPGSLAIVRGVNLASVADSASHLPLATTLGGTRVTMNNIEAPIFYTASGELGVQTPAGIHADSAVIRVVNALGGSNSYRIGLSTVSPAIFADPDQSSQAQVYRFGDDGEGWVTPAMPLRRGDMAVMVAGGLGAATVQPRDGERGAGESHTIFHPKVSIGGVSATVLYSNLGDYPGVYWVYFMVPPEVPNGAAVTLQLSANGIESMPSKVPVGGAAPVASPLRIGQIAHPAWDGPARLNTVYNPGSLIEIAATGLKPNAPGYLRCSNLTGYQASSPVVSISETVATAVVPAYIDSKTNDYASGTVSCTLAQPVGNDTVVSDSFQVQIQAPPTAPGNPGTLTLAVVLSGIRGTHMVQTNLTLKEQASAGQAFSASNTRAEMDNIAAAFVPFVDAIRIISSGKQQSVTLGKDAKGKPITITRDALAKTDRRLAMLISESAASAFYDEGSAGSVVPKAPGAAASGFALFIKLGAQCLNPLGEEAAVFFGYPSPNESCSKFQDFKSQVKEGLVDAWGIAMQKTATNVSRTMSRIGAAAVLLTPLAGEEAVTELLVDVAARAGVAKTLAKAYQEFTKVTTDYSPEDRQSMLDNARDGIDAGTSDSINEGMADQIDSRFQDLVAHTASDDPLLTKLLDLQDKELSLLEKLRDQPAQTALIQVRNPDGSYSLVSDVLPGPVNTVSGKMLDSANAPVAEGYVEFGNGSQLQTPYAMAAINADGTFQLPVPANQVGKTIPSTVALQFNLPNAGGPGYIAYSGPSVGIGQSNLTLSPLRFGSSGGCGTNGSVCLAD